ncbi:hypothetical protein Leryth_017852 [Lithospermum erythrorhizon]|uniref:Uncharacterized protein n=1 Tax=Lithospermum erythrorhizon TaxID=34254 RepID=A0AAV3QG39_LITER|nr:hypothetical protein Leryth_017852 [Lithospermum erythrorhizon]
MVSSSVICSYLCLLLLLPLQIKSAKNNNTDNNPQIAVMGMVYCDICSDNAFSKHSYFLPGVQVRIDCKFQAIAPRTSEQISFSVNRTTNKHGIYRLEVPSVDGIQCARDKAVGNSCRASLIKSSVAACNVPGFTSTTDQIAIKAKQTNMCIYSLNALTFRPSKRNVAFCGGRKH